MTYFMVPANQLTLSPRGDIPVFFMEDTKCVQCVICNDVWVSEPPQGHVCYPPLEPKLAWSA